MSRVRVTAVIYGGDFLWRQRVVDGTKKCDKIMGRIAANGTAVSINAAAELTAAAATTAAAVVENT